MTVTKRVRRSAQVEGNVLEMKSPDFISVVKKPANQRAFSVVRSADGAEPTKRTMRRQRRSDTAGLARLVFPAELTEEQVKGNLKEFGLESFTVSRSAEAEPWVASNGAIACTEKDLIVHKINEDGVLAYVKRSEAAEATSGKTKLAVVAIRFDDETITRADAESWLSENAVDFDEKALNNSSGKFVLQRAELEEGEETRQVELEEGVVAVVKRSDSMDIPDGFVLVVNELCYQGYGWGMVDFNANLADRTIGENLREAGWVLQDTLSNILYYNSELTIEAKKALISRTAQQYADYVNLLLDQLPRQLLVSVADASPTTVKRSDNTKESADMSKEDANKPAVLTKEDVASVVLEVLRSDREREEKEKIEAEQRAEREAEEARVRRSEIEDIIKEAQAPLLDEIKALKGTTVVRSDNSDPEGQPVEEKRVQRSVFSGILGSVSSLRDISEDDDGADQGAGDEE